MFGARIFAVISALTVLAMAQTAPNATILPLPPFATPLSHSGRWLTDAQGRAVIYKGINVAYKLPPYTPQAQGFTEEDAAVFAREGFAVVRVWIHWKSIEPSPGVWDDESLVALKEFIGWLHQYNIGTMLNFGQVVWGEKFGGIGFPDWAANTQGPSNPQNLTTTNMTVIDHGFTDPACIQALDSFWENQQFPDEMPLQDHFNRAWEHVVTFFLDVPGIVGYDPINEPTRGTGAESGCAVPEGCPSWEQDNLTPFYTSLVEVIRNIDPTTMILYEPNVIVGAGFPTGVSAGDDKNLALSFHYYLQPDYNISASQSIATKEDTAQLNGDGILLAEFGATDDLDVLTTVMDAAEAARLGWMYWAWYSTEPSGDLPPGEIDHPEKGIIHNPMLPPTEDNLKPEKLAVLNRPYPYLVAGTPEAYHFDNVTRVFQLNYTTTPVGPALSANATTIIIVSERLYPGGSYNATVTGGQIVSLPGAQALTISATAGVDKVSVVVTPTWN